MSAVATVANRLNPPSGKVGRLGRIDEGLRFAIGDLVTFRWLLIVFSTSRHCVHMWCLLSSLTIVRAEVGRTRGA